MGVSRGWLGWAVGCIGMALVAQGSSDSEERALRLLDLKALLATPVRVATGTATSWQHVPASVTVITDAELESSGATTLDEALALVPGVHVSHSGQNYAPRYFIRGIVSAFNPEVLVLLNGVPLSSLMRGDRSIIGPRFPTELIARIEVVRGPGSAVHGADAFAGVVNIITKGPVNFEGTGGGVRGGSFQTRTAWASHGGSWGAIPSSLVVSHTRTEGHKGVVEADAQTGFDDLAVILGIPTPRASRAPGPLSLMGRYTDLFWEVGGPGLQARVLWQDRRGLGVGQGGTGALDPEGRLAGQRVLVEGRISHSLAPAWQAQASLSYFRGSQEIERNLHLFPAGAFFGAFPEGFQGNPGFREDRRRLEGSLVFTGVAGHRLRFGGGYSRGSVYHIRETKNFDATFAPLPGGLTDVSGTPDDFMEPHSTEQAHAFLQDEWTLGRDATVTLGLRGDRYRSFGTTLNPRLGVVWTLRPGITWKGMAGSAFRAPAFAELYTRNNPVAMGNATLTPERLNMVETSLAWEVGDGHHFEVGAYGFWIRDFIQFLKDPGLPTTTARNSGRQSGKGVETGWLFAPSSRFRAQLQGSFQHTRNEATGHALGESPRWKASLRIEGNPWSRFHGHLHLAWVGLRERPAQDPRPDLPGFATLDFTLRWERALGPLEVRLLVRNALDRDVREPSQAPSPGAAFVDIPHDLPQAGRSVMLELAWRGR